MIDWLVDHPNAFLAFWIVVVIAVVALMWAYGRFDDED